MKQALPGIRGMRTRKIKKLPEKGSEEPAGHGLGRTEGSRQALLAFSNPPCPPPPVIVQVIFMKLTQR